MKKYRAIATMILFILITFAASISAYANSSWSWISESRPYDILPFVIIGTLLIETIAINYIPKIHKLGKVFMIVTLGNLLSYLVPYAFHAMGAATHIFEPMELNDYLAYLPSYNVGFVYLFLTITVELPVCYFILRKDTEKKKILLLTVIIANVTTTVLVWIVERIICKGIW